MAADITRMAGILSGVRPLGPHLYAAVAAFTLLVSLPAEAIPACRVMRVDSMIALRDEQPVWIAEKIRDIVNLGEPFVVTSCAVLRLNRQ